MFLNEKSRLLFVIGFRSLVLNYTFMMRVVSNCLRNIINYIWFINILHIKDSIVFYCFEETCIRMVIFCRT